MSEAQKDTTESDPSLPSIITSTEVLGRVINSLHLDTDPIALGKKVKTKLPLKSSILALTYKDTDGDRAATVLNKVADESAIYYHEIALRGYNEVIAALTAKIAQCRARIADADKRLQRTSSLDTFARSDKSMDDFAEQVLALKNQRDQIYASLAGDRANVTALKNQQSHIAGITRAEILQKDPVYQQLQMNFGRDLADLSSERSSFRETFPGLSALARRVERERGELRKAESTAVENGSGLSATSTQTVLDGERAVALTSADAERLRATDIRVSAEQAQLATITSRSATISTLRAERDAAVSEYLALTQRLGSAQADAAQAASLGTLVVVSRAIPGKSSLWLWLAALAFLTLAASVAAAYLVEIADRRFWGATEIQGVYRRPVFVEVGRSL